MAKTRDFWSKRRAGVAAEAEAEAAAMRAAEAEEHDAALAERPDAEILEELGLREPEALESTEEVQAFLRAAVPQRLKTRALRRLWRLNPVLANLDGLVEYGGDYTDAATVVENLQTAYQVGKGMLARFEEIAEVAEDLAEAVETPETDAVEPVDPPAPEPEPQVAFAEAPAADPEPDDRPAPPRRMRFTFDQST